MPKLILLAAGVFLSFANLLPQPQISLDEIASGFNSPVAIANAGDDRLFIVERQGIIKIIDGSGSVLSLPFLDIRSRVVSTGGEQGLLGLAFDPDYTTNGHFFVNYIGAGDSSHIVRFSVSADPDIANAASEVRVLSQEQPYTNHNGGDVKFGPDGFLYAGFGDGGSGGDPGNRAQTTSTALGKLLRMDVSSLPYTVPADNPFVGQPAYFQAIWALGLRNPWRFSFDRSTGDLWLADVGQSAWEEVNLQPSSSSGGENYGWRCYEADVPYNLSGCGPAGNYTVPVHKYPNTGFTGDCSITGGYVYRGTQFPAMEGYYFFGDYCSSKLWSLHDHAGNWVSDLHGVFANNWFSTFGEGNDGELYVAGVKSGKIFHLVDTSGSTGVEKKIQPLAGVFPNPVTDVLHLRRTDPGTAATFVLNDAFGRRILEVEWTGAQHVIDFSGIRAGLYVGSLISEGEVLTSRIVKK